MQNPSVLKRHAHLVDQMAGKLAVDLEEEVLRGNLPADEVPDAVLRCTACSNPDFCETWLEGRDSAEQPPAFCRNVELFERLKP